MYPNRVREKADLHFFNYVYSFDQVGILQRKLMEVNDQLQSIDDPKGIPPETTVVFCPDINRMLPGKESGFENLNDRLWSYSNS